MLMGILRGCGKGRSQSMRARADLWQAAHDCLDSRAPGVGVSRSSRRHRSSPGNRMTFESRIAAVAAAALLSSAAAHAQAPFPSKSVTLVVSFATGGSTDIITRIIAKELTSQLGRPAVVDNRTGGGGVIGWSAVARAPADGYTLLATELSFAIAAGLIPGLPFDPRTGFTQVVTATSVPHVLVVTPSLPVKTVKEFIALAKARPGELNYGSGGT